MLGFKKKIMTLHGKLNQQCLFDMKNVGNDRRCNTHISRIAVVIVPLNPNECELCSQQTEDAISNEWVEIVKHISKM